MNIAKFSTQRVRLKYNLSILFTIITVFFITTLVQGYFTWNSINEEQKNRKRMERNVKNEKIDELKQNVERIVNNSASGFEQAIDNPEEVKQLLIAMMQKNPEVLGSAVAYVPGYLPNQSKLYAPYSYRQDGNIKFKILSYDYTNYDWYLNVADKQVSGWCNPYADQDGTFALMSTYSIPLHDSSNQVVAVLTADLPMSEISQVADTLYHKASMRSILILCLQIFGILLIIFITWRSVANMKKFEKLNEDKQRISNELNMASHIQADILPAKYPQHPRLAVHASLKPAPHVSGDFYDFTLIGQKFFFCIGDVAKEGMGAALAMTIARTVYRTHTDSEMTPANVMGKINQALCNINEQQMFATLFAGMIDLNTGLLTYCNAGHLPPYLLSGGKSAPLPINPNVPLGLNDWTFEEQQLQLQPSDLLFLYTDGIIETMNQYKESFGEKKLSLHLKNACNDTDTPETLVKRISTALHHHMGVDGKPGDDLTMLAICYKAL